MIVIPSLELRGGCVVAPDDGALLADDPVAVARALRDDGALFFQLVDLDAVDGAGDAASVLERFVDAGLPCQVAGGVRDVERAARLLEIGVDRIVVGSVLRDAPETASAIAGAAGPRAIAAIDVERGADDVAERVRRAVELGFVRLQVAMVEDRRPAPGADVGVLEQALSVDGVEVFAHVCAASRDDLRALKPLFERGLGGIVLATASRTLAALAG